MRVSARGGRILAEIVAAVALLTVVLSADPTGPGGPFDLFGRNDQATLRAASGTLEVGRWQTVDDVWMGRGHVLVRGTVDGDVTVASGTATIRGQVRGDVTVIDGAAVVVGDATIGGRLRASDPSVVDPSAMIAGGQAQLSVADLPDRLVVLGLLAAAAAVGLLLTVAKVMARRRPVSAVDRAIDQAPLCLFVGAGPWLLGFMVIDATLLLVPMIVIGLTAAVVAVRGLRLTRSLAGAWAFVGLGACVLGLISPAAVVGAAAAVAAWAVGGAALVVARRFGGRPSGVHHPAARAVEGQPARTAVAAPGRPALGPVGVRPAPVSQLDRGRSHRAHRRQFDDLEARLAATRFHAARTSG